MTRLLSFAFLLISFGALLSSCDKDYEKMEIIRDCTGDYLRTKSGIDYYVCNEEIIESFATGEKIKVSYDNLEECFGILEQPTCELAHSFNGKIEIIDIK